MESASTSRVSKWPRFTDGDVLIVLSPSRQYQLHSKTLKSLCTYFEALFQESHAPKLSAKAKKEGVVVRYRAELEESSPEHDRGPFGRLALRVGTFLHLSIASVSDRWIKRLDERGRYKARLRLSDLDHGLQPKQLYQYYDNFLRCFYHQPLHLTEGNINQILNDVVCLVNLADNLGAIRVVSAIADSALVRHGQTLWRSIQSDPVAWVELASRIESETIFREAIIHLVGNWNFFRRNEDRVGHLSPEVFSLVKRKYDNLDSTKRAIEIRLLGHYPANMYQASAMNNNVGAGSVTTRGRGDSTRAKPLKDNIFYWMVVAYFRQWLGQHICGDMSRFGADGGYKFYKAIHVGGSSYLRHEDVESFLGFFPMSSKSRTQFDKALGELKEALRPYVKALMKVNCMLDTHKISTPYLTCVDVDKQDLPWVNASGFKQGEESAAPMEPSALPQHTPSSSARKRRGIVELDEADQPKRPKISPLRGSRDYDDAMENDSIVGAGPAWRAPSVGCEAIMFAPTHDDDDDEDDDDDAEEDEDDKEDDNDDDNDDVDDDDDDNKRDIRTQVMLASYLAGGALGEQSERCDNSGEENDDDNEGEEGGDKA